jgi:hypothetical protein
MKLPPVFKASTIAVFSSSNSWSSSGIPLLPRLARKNLSTEEGDSLAPVIRRRFPRPAADAAAGSADPLFSANEVLILPVPPLDSFGGLTWGFSSAISGAAVVTISGLLYLLSPISALA